MMQHNHLLVVDTPGRCMVDLTRRITGWIERTGVQTGILTALCRHTSASLSINENASESVQRDVLAWLERMAPEDADYEHGEEGPDDMPAHLKSALTGVSLSIPLDQGRMMLGLWQGVFLIEHRTAPRRREIALHLIGE